MVDDLFIYIGELIQSTPSVALFGAFIWGILSVLLSPCHLGSIPLIAGYIGGGRKLPVKEAFKVSLVFAFGLLIAIGLIGIITSMMGRLLGDIGSWTNIFVGAVFILVGIYLMDILPFHIPGISGLKSRRRGFAGAFILGLLFGVALGPCTFAFMAPVMVVAFAKASETPVFSISLFWFYGLGYSSIIAVAGASTKYIQKYLNWSSESKGTLIIKRICSILVIVTGIYIIWK